VVKLFYLKLRSGTTVGLYSIALGRFSKHVIDKLRKKLLQSSYANRRMKKLRERRLRSLTKLV
jgi:hypothetical protein